MFRLFNSALMVSVLLAILVAAPALAATTPAPATSLKDAGAPLPGWVEVEPGAVQWYKFKYHYDNSDKDNEPTQALVQLRMNAPENVIFEVWTPERLRAPLPDPSLDLDEQEGTVRVPVGMGTPAFAGKTWHWDLGDHAPNRHTVVLTDKCCLTWAGSARATDTYYVVVKNKGDTTASYKLSITGPEISF
ncbi:MAG: hypothetical protein DCC55_31650 [Chloroflexi bacterium]|nr:MAG: hypothetical protein DCC55_31650 [Chloroflexota bacterium]